MKRPEMVANLKKSWPILVAVLGLNFWYDYYHPGGLILDAIILVYFLMKFAVWSKL